MNFPKFLRFIMLPWAEYVKINATTTVKKTHLHPVDVEVASLFAKMYKFSYEFVSPSDGEVGRQLSNGNWTGLVGMLLRYEGDVVVSVLSITVERMDILDFSFPLQRAPITFVTTKPEYSPDITALLKPFSADLWISLVVLLIILPAIFFTFLKRGCTYGKLLLATFQSLLGQQMGIRTTNIKEYFLMYFYIISTFFIIQSYTCILLSFITFPTFTGVRTIRELAAAVTTGKYQCVSYPGTFIGAALSISKDSEFEIIGRNLQQNEGSSDILNVLRSSKENSKRAFIGTIEGLKPFKAMYFVSQDEFFNLFLALGMRKDFCCREQVTRFLMYISSSGLYQRALEHYAFRESLKYVFDIHEGSANQRIRHFTLVDVAGAFFVLCIGYSISIAVFIFEMTFSKNLKCSPRT